MNGGAQALIVIPARYASSRLPGKPLALLGGRTLLSRTVEVARAAAAMADDTDVLVATDDERIAQHARALDCTVAMTDPAITSGTGRVHAAVAGLPRPPALVVNLQGDAPFTPPAVVAALIRALRDGEDAAATPCFALSWAALDALRRHKQAAPFSGTTCIRAPDGRALWFSKSILPAIRDEAALRATAEPSPVLQHIGLYAFRLEALARFAAAMPSRYEAIEGLEQLRLLELGLPLRLIEVPPPAIISTGIDTPADLVRGEALLEGQSVPMM